MPNLQPLLHAWENLFSEIMRLFQEGGQLHVEVNPVVGARLQDLDLLRFRVFLQDYRGIVPEDAEIPQLMQNLQILDANHLPTVYGMLMFGKEPQRWLPQSGLDLCFFAGEDKNSDILDRKTLQGTIPELIKHGLDFIRFNSATRSYFNQEGTLRTDVADYDPFVVRELLVNAFAHRDWSVFGQQVRCYLYRDRLEVFSPGKLPNTLSLNNALAGVSYYRNPLIAQALKDYQLADRLGRGLSRIVSFYRDKSLPTPTFHEDPTYFQIIVQKANP